MHGGERWTDGQVADSSAHFAKLRMLAVQHSYSIISWIAICLIFATRSGQPKTPTDGCVSLDRCKMSSCMNAVDTGSSARQASLHADE